MNEFYAMEMLKYEFSRLAKQIDNIKYQLSYLKDYMDVELDDFEELNQIHLLYSNSINKINQAQELLEQKQEKET